MKEGKPRIGVICNVKYNATEKHLLPELRKKFDVTLFPIQNDIEYEKMKEMSRWIKVILNTAGDMPNVEDGQEIIKTFEGIGKHVIDSSHSFYYTEDKWLFYQVCLKHKLPTPKTYYIPRTITLSRGRLNDIMSEGPVVFKGIFSDTGRAVKRAMNYEEAMRVLSKFHRSLGVMPVVAQRYVPHGTVSYRVTMLGDKIIQGIVKSGKNWKEGKLFWKNEKYRTFKPDRDLRKLCKKISKVFGIEWLGIDLMRDAVGNWYIIEVNSNPSLDFVISDMKRVCDELVNYLVRVERKFR
jgi:glutathione synthase/RimK-type ligase-like ATP-grasp enzyme